ncbi:hypothetical protein Vi05172_g5691 [Venturia inaequalis]|nr:hypothetical protein Vi05172_g5691 [Venturia inaequalis]
MNADASGKEVQYLRSQWREAVLVLWRQLGDLLEGASGDVETFGAFGERLSTDLTQTKLNLQKCVESVETMKWKSFVEVVSALAPRDPRRQPQESSHF